MTAAQLTEMLRFANAVTYLVTSQKAAIRSMLAALILTDPVQEKENPRYVPVFAPQNPDAPIWAVRCSGTEWNTPGTAPATVPGLTRTGGC